MTERYTRLFLLDENLYREGSPVIVRAGALLKDNQTDNVLAQIKYQNISPNQKNIKALRVAVTPMDVRRQTLGEPIEFDYLDLSIPRDGEFGQKTPIPLPDRNARSFSVAIIYAVFEDNTEMMPRSGAYQSIPRQRTLAGALQDNDIATEYAHRFGSQCPMVVMEFADLWLCSCGAVNRSSETNCHSCKNNFKQMTTVDYEQLKKDFQNRMAKEAEERKERELAAEHRREEEEKAAEERKRKVVQEEQIEKERKRKQFRKRFAIVAGIGIVLVSSILLYTKIIVPAQTYKKAVALYEEQKYREAIKLFSKIREYKDSRDYLNISSFGNYKISYDEQGRISQIGNFYQFSYGEKDKIKRIIPQNRNETCTLQEEKDSFSVEFKKNLQDDNKIYKFNEYGILQEGESKVNYNQTNDWTIREHYDYHIEMDEDTHFPIRGERTYQFEKDTEETLFTDSYTFGIDENDKGEIVFWKNKNGKKTNYPIEYTVPKETVSSKIAAQNERLIMAFCLMLPTPQSPL